MKEIKVDINNSKSNIPYMSVVLNKKVYNLNSKYNPKEEARRWAEDIDVNSYSVIILFGIELGYRLNEILSRKKDSLKIIIIEPSDRIFQEMLKSKNGREALSEKNVEAIVGSICKENIEKVLDWSETEKILIKTLPNYEKIFINEYKDFSKVIKEVISEKVISRNTIMHFSKLWQKNILQNIKYIVQSEGLEKFENIFKDKPIIIVSAGPSLNKNIQSLAKAKRKSIIICVGTALKPLLINGIEPDFIITLDAGEANYRHFEGIEYSHIPIIYAPYVEPRVLENHKGEKYIFYVEDGSISKILDSFKIRTIALGTGGSVSNSALDLATFLGGNPIVLVGQDLAYTDNKSHARDTIRGLNEVEFDKTKHKIVKDIYDRDIITDEVMLKVLRWFEHEIRKYEERREFIDATQGGVRIKGTRLSTLDQVISEYCKEDVFTYEKVKSLNLFNKSSLIEKKKAIVKELKLSDSKIEALEKLIIKAKQTRDEEELNILKVQIKNLMLTIGIFHYAIQPIIYRYINDDYNYEYLCSKIIEEIYFMKDLIRTEMEYLSRLKGLI